MVVSYDRRGNGRSPAPPGWQTTSPQEQADDAAGLLQALGAGPVAVFSTSSGGNFTLCLLVRHPGWVRGAILHEPGLYALVDDFDAVRAPLRALVQEAMAAGGPPAAVERFWCYVAGEDGWDRLAPALRERLRATAGTFVGVELGTYELYLPDDAALAAIAPVFLLVSEDSLPFFAEIAARLGQRLGVEVATAPGTHATYHEHPRELADIVRPFLRQVSGSAIPADVRQTAASDPAAPSAARTDRDIYRLAPTVDAGALAAIAERLEFRGQDEGYARLSQAYFGRLPLAQAQRILALGCGTGIEVRARKHLTGPEAAIVGIDHSPVLIDAARRLTADEGLSGNITYQTGDAHHLPYGEHDFDIVTLHTLISHVDDPLQVLREARRVVRPGGTVAIFDGDYASLTFAYPDPALARTIEDKLIQLIVANPRIMRDMSRLLPAAGLKLAEADGALYPNIGTGDFWSAAIESYGPLLARSGLLAQATVEDWQAFQARAVQSNTFFAASSYYTYLARRPA